MTILMDLIKTFLKKPSFFFNYITSKEYTILGDNMFQKLLNLCRFWVGLRLLGLIAALILVIITLYQMLICLFIPCFWNVLILLIEFLSLIFITFWIIFC